MKVCQIRACLAGLLTALSVRAATPYTHQNFLDDPEEFHFAIIPDRTGGDLRGAWTNALAKVNLMRPEFVMTVGDLIPASWLDEASIVAQQEELQEQLKSVVPPFYSVVGNHDIQSPLSKRIWQRYFGKDTYYGFLYKGALFVALDSQDEGISDAQYAWVRKLLNENAGVRWTFLFMHSPDTWRGERWRAFERDGLSGRNYTVFAGDLHTFFHARRNGNDYYALSVAGGGSAMNGQDPSQHMNLLGPDHGEMDHFTWVTVPKAGRPVIANIRLDGIFAGDYLDQSNSKTTYVTKAYDDPVDPEVAQRLEKLDRRSQELFYRWDAKTFDRWTAPGGGVPAATWSIEDREIRWDATQGPTAIELATDYGNADWHFQYKLEKGAEAKLVYVEANGAVAPVEYVMADGLCRPQTWTHGRMAVTGRLVTFEINGVRSGTLTRADDRPAGHFQLRAVRGKGAFRGIYVYDLRK